MEKEVPYEQALALKELGFDEPCFDYYIPDKNNDPISKIFNSYELGKHNSNTNTIYKNGIISRPLYQQAFSFFREKYKLYATLPRSVRSETFAYVIATESDCWYRQQDRFKTYEEAELECIKTLIEIVNKKS